MEFWEELLAIILNWTFLVNFCKLFGKYFYFHCKHEIDYYAFIIQKLKFFQSIFNKKHFGYNEKILKRKRAYFQTAHKFVF